MLYSTHNTKNSDTFLNNDKLDSFVYTCVNHALFSVLDKIYKNFAHGNNIKNLYLQSKNGKLKFNLCIYKEYFKEIYTSYEIRCFTHDNDLILKLIKDLYGKEVSKNVDIHYNKFICRCDNFKGFESNSYSDHICNCVSIVENADSILDLSWIHTKYKYNKDLKTTLLTKSNHFNYLDNKAINIIANTLKEVYNIIRAEEWVLIDKYNGSLFDYCELCYG